MKDVVIYTVDYCPFCEKAKILLDNEKISYKEIDITPNEKEYREKLGEYYDIKGKVTVPQIIIGNKRIGGYDKLKELHDNNALNDLLKD